MCQEIFRMALGMDLKSVEMQLALQCAPLITGVRISNLLMIESCNEPALRLVLKRSGISYFKLGQTEGKTAFLLNWKNSFRRTIRWRFLKVQDMRNFLLEAFCLNLKKDTRHILHNKVCSFLMKWGCSLAIRQKM